MLPDSQAPAQSKIADGPPSLYIPQVSVMDEALAQREKSETTASHLSRSLPRLWKACTDGG